MVQQHQPQQNDGIDRAGAPEERGGGDAGSVPYSFPTVRTALPEEPRRLMASGGGPGGYPKALWIPSPFLHQLPSLQTGTILTQDLPELPVSAG